MDKWKELLKEQFESRQYKQLLRTIELDSSKHNVFPSSDKIFRALELCDFDKVKVVILGQDPYHGYGQANGLAFAVDEDNAPPPSLQNIMKEARVEDYDPSLIGWAKQGVLLLNTILTVREREPMSHAGWGWETITDTIIKKLNESDAPIVFMLWGNPSKQKASLITNSKHLILTSVHPSPLSVYKGFFGCGHFTKANEFLKQAGLRPINWRYT